MISLDDLTALEKNDPSGMTSVIASFPDHCRDAIRIALDSKIPYSYKAKYKNIVCTGMGGSAIGADMVRSYVCGEALTPILVNRNYDLPAFVSKDSLVVVSSYSGNTSETISAFNDAAGKGAKIVLITTGGRLKELADKRSIPVINIPSGIQPRAAIGYSFFTLLIILTRMGLVRNKKKDIDEALALVSAMSETGLGPGVPEAKNIAKKIAAKLHMKIPVIYSNVDHMDSISIRWRGQLAENSKNLASSGLFPEIFHNEIVGWEHPAKTLKALVVILLRDRGDRPEAVKKMDFMKKEIRGLGVDVVEIGSRGKGLLARMLSLMYIGDYVSLYLAALNKCDPTPVDRIVRLKKVTERS